MIKIYTCIALVFVTVGIAQKKELKSADRDFNNMDYISATDGYLKVVEKKGGTVDLYKRLGDLYYFNGFYADANKWYGELFGSTTDNREDIEPIYYLRYLQSTPASNNDLKVYKELSQKGVLKKTLVSVPGADHDWLPFTRADSLTIRPVKTNGASVDIPAVFQGERLLFSSARDTGLLAKSINVWDHGYFSKLYEAGIDSMGKMHKVRKLGRKVNKKYHVAGAVLNNDGSTLYFSRNRNRNEMANLKLYRATYRNGKWMDVVELPFNKDRVSTAFPALSPDGKRLYFSSDRPGSVGSSDIYYVDVLENGNYGEPVSLGPAVNTIGRESFSHIDSDGILYFSSDGYSSHGGLDVYAARPDSNGGYGQVVNLGEGINGPEDDFGFIFSREAKMGFMASEGHVADKGRGMYMLTCCGQRPSHEDEDKGAIAEGDTGDGTRGSKGNDDPKEVKDVESGIGHGGPVVKNNVFYTVQLGAFKKEDAAMELMHVLDSTNLNVLLAHGSLYRVYSGVFQDKRDADEHLKEMQRKGHKNAFVKKLTN